MEKNNVHTIKGVIFEKPVREVPDKKNKNNGEPYKFPSIILELVTKHKEKEYRTLPEFELGNRGLNLDDFAVGDKVEITFAMEGKAVSPTWHKTTAKCLYIRHTDIQYDDSADTSSDKPRRENKKEKDIFEASLPYANGDNDPDTENLPF
jgi:hypothetical protein